MKWLGGVMLVLLSLTGNAQKTVFQNLTWEQAAELAQKENKIILVDAMREPATPEARKQKDKEEAVWQKVAANLEFCKQHVVAIRIDMASEAGKEFAPKLVMNMYPTYGFFMPNGDILGTVSPFLLAKNPELFLERGKKAWEQAEVKRNNKRSIVFEEIGLKEALEKAKKENKLVFIDAYTAWCQPCVMMGKNVFTLDKVADFYNRNFINLKIDFGKEKELAEKYAVRGYPAFLFLNGNGKLVHAGGGYTEADAFIGYGQEALKKAEGIVFFKGTWQQALEQARKENKLIFMDCYTSWCGPCKMLAKEVFTDPEVAAFFNEKFVNVKVDMEKGEGMELKEQYKVSAYPTLNFIDGNGGLQHCVVGGMPADALIAQAKLALEGKGLIALQTLYVQGNRESQFIEDYLTALDMGNQAAEAEKVALDYLGKIVRAQLKEKANWDMFNKYSNDVDSDIFRYVYDNRNEFAGLFGEKEVKAKIRKVWTLGANRYVTGEGEEVVYDQKGFKKYVKRLSKADVDGKTDIIENARMTNAEKLGDWKTYIALGSEQLKNGKVGDLVLYNWGLRINRGCKDSALRMQAAQWFDDAAAKSKEGPMSFKVYFERVANDLKQDYKESK